MVKKKRYKSSFRTALIKLFIQNNNEWMRVSELQDFFCIKNNAFLYRTLKSPVFQRKKEYHTEYDSIFRREYRSKNKIYFFRVKEKLLGSYKWLVRNKIITPDRKLIKLELIKLR